MAPTTEKIGLVMVLGSVFLWATVGVSVELVPGSDVLTPEMLAFARTSVGGATIVVIAFLVRGQKAFQSHDLYSVHTVLFAFSNAVFQVGLFWSFKLLGVTVTAFLTGCLPPVLAMAWDWLRRPAYLPPSNLLALGLASIGLAAFVGAGDTRPDAGSWHIGLAMALVTSAAFVTMSLASLQLGRTRHPFVASGIGLSLSGVILLLVLVTQNAGLLASIASDLSAPPLIGLAIYLGVVPTALAFILFCKGVEMCQSALVGLIASMTRPPFAAVLSIWLLADTPDPAEAVGCLLLMLAMVPLWRGQNARERKAIAPRATDVPAD